MSKLIELDFLKKVDIFDAAMPTFNLNGEKSVRTVCGGVITIVILCITFLFSSTKFEQMLRRQNPTVNNYLRKDEFAGDERLSLTESNFMMAFTLEHFISGETLDDPRYLKWVAWVRFAKDGEIRSREVPVFPCRDGDYAKLYPVDDRSLSRLRKMRNSPDMQLYCIDWETAQIEIYGLESGNDFAYLDISVVPCNQRETVPMIGGKTDRISEDCIWDKEA